MGQHETSSACIVLSGGLSGCLQLLLRSLRVHSRLMGRGTDQVMYFAGKLGRVARRAFRMLSTWVWGGHFLQYDDRAQLDSKGDRCFGLWFRRSSP